AGRDEHHRHDADRRSNTGSDGPPECGGVDASDPGGEPDGGGGSTLYPPPEGPESEAPKVGLARRHRALDPVEVSPDLLQAGLGRSWSQGFHGWAAPRG